MIEYDGKCLKFKREIRGDDLLKYIEGAVESSDIYVKDIKLLGPYKRYERVRVYSPIFEFKIPSFIKDADDGEDHLSFERNIFTILVNKDEVYTQIKLRKSLFFGHGRGPAEFIRRLAESLDDQVNDGGFSRVASILDALLSQQ
ncbi:MAG: hypothetical protein OH316_01905 [Candidatus Parvarchaeota archaeon]|nr:hypothetical protein [Candidatus Parvarchaeota archaeon]